MLFFSGSLEDHTLVFLQVSQGEVGSLGVASILPRKDLTVPAHGARVNQQKVEAPAGPLANAGVAHGRHHNANVKVPAAKGNVGQLVGVPAGQHHVVHQNEHLPLNPLLSEVRLLFQEFVDECLVPFREKHPGVPFGVPVHHGLETGRAGGRTDEGHNEVKLLEQQIR